MITELKRTPITWNGKDGWEILVEHDYPCQTNICELCMYGDPDEMAKCEPSCITVHDCGMYRRTYFIFEKS